MATRINGVRFASLFDGVCLNARGERPEKVTFQVEAVIPATGDVAKIGVTFAPGANAITPTEIADAWERMPGKTLVRVTIPAKLAASSATFGTFVATIKRRGNYASKDTFLTLLDQASYDDAGPTSVEQTATAETAATDSAKAPRKGRKGKTATADVATADDVVNGAPTDATATATV